MVMCIDSQFASLIMRVSGQRISLTPLYKCVCPDGTKLKIANVSFFPGSMLVIVRHLMPVSIH